jgi:hypothetical protein
MTFLVAYDDNGIESEPFTTLDDLCSSVDMNQLLFKIQFTGLYTPGIFFRHVLSR